MTFEGFDSSRRPDVPLGRGEAALAGVAAGAAALGVAELLAGILPGAASPVVAVGDLVIALQPAGAKQIVVDLFGEADKLLLNLLIVGVALGFAAGLGVLARRHERAAELGFTGLALLILAASLRDPLAAPVMSLLSAVVALVVGVTVLRFLLGRARAERVAEMPAWGRRRFLVRSGVVLVGAAASGVIGRVLLDSGRASVPPVAVPDPVATAPPLPEGASLDVAELSPIVTPTERFYRIDTALIVPRPDIGTWRLRVTGMVDRELEFTYNELLARPLVEQYVTIACVSNEVGGDLVGNALWRGVPLKELLSEAGVRPESTQIVGRAVDGFTAGFPTVWALADQRESLVALAMNGEPLPADHGWPARLIVPGLYGYVSATKWLTEIELTTLEAFDAYWVPLGWAKEAPILTQSRIDTPRDGTSIPAGDAVIAGVAWAPDRGVRGVEVQADDGAWTPAELSTPISDATWVQWRLPWAAVSGEHTLRVRATDGAGEVQTADVTRPAPDGARGHHTIRVRVD